MTFPSLSGTVDTALLESLVREIAAVEDELEREAHSQVELVEKISLHVLKAGGKRLRPAFVALSAGATGRPFDRARAYRIAACMEMIHIATLIHDDVIDNAATRRGRATASSVFGNTESILSGDVLLSKAMSILAQDGDIEIIRTVSSAVVELAEGEVRELEVRGRFDLSEEDHLDILRMKTATFIRSCCEVGGRIAGATDDVLAALGRYGYHIGMAFQIADDLLDYRGDPSATGKPAATDFREGCQTLPLIRLRSTLDITERERIELLFGDGATDDDIREICRQMQASGAFDAAEECARAHICEAKSELRALPPSKSRDLLETAADYVLARTS